MFCGVFCVCLGFVFFYMVGVCDLFWVLYACVRVVCIVGMCVLCVWLSVCGCV